MTRPTYIVTDMAMALLEESTGYAQEFKTEKAALTAGKEWLGTIHDDEVWVWKLSHIISKPQVEPEVEKVG